MEKGIVKTLKYFAQFGYAPTLAELRMFHPEAIQARVFDIAVKSLIKKNRVLWIKSSKCQDRYTLGGYSILLNKTLKKVGGSRNKVTRIQPYINFLKKFDAFSLIGFSGSVAMENAEPDADIDLFVIARPGSMWTARATALAAAEYMGVRRGRTSKSAPNKVCLNMFMDERDLTVPKYKQTAFVAHEILQMKPVFDRRAIYNRFLKANSWIYKFFPNARQNRGRIKSNTSMKSANPILEAILKKIQLTSINRHRTTEIITDTQLWFFPDDYEKKVKV